MISHSDLKRYRVKRNLARACDRILTSEKLLLQEHFEEPQIITSRFFNFNFLLSHRNAIRDLRLMPLKAEDLHGSYNALSRQVLINELTQKMGKEPMALMLNQYPYALPKDVLQCILWIRKDDASRVEIIKFLARMMRKYELDDLDLIAFERPGISRSKYIKRSFPFMRHVHIWLRKSSLQTKSFDLE